MMFFGARTPQALPYFGPLSKLPENLIDSHLVYSRSDKKEYVQDRMLSERKQIAELLNDETTHIYICGLRDMESGVNESLAAISLDNDVDWLELRDRMRGEGRYHVETY